MAAAIVKRQHGNIVRLGIDIEDSTREIQTDISGYILTPWERDRWSISSISNSHNARIIFSIKECIYKCLFPINRVVLGFQDAEVTEITKSEFQVRLLKNPIDRDIQLPFYIQGKLANTENSIFSAVSVTGDLF